MLKNAFLSGINEYRKHDKLFFQTGILFSAQIAVIGLGLLIKGIQTRSLGPEDYGLYAFFGSLIGFTVLIFRFGFFTSIKVLLANNEDAGKEKEYFGAGVILAILVGLLFAGFLFVLSYFVDGVFNIEFGSILRLVSPLCFVLTFQYLVSEVSIGSNKVENSAIFDVLSKILFLIPLAALFFYKDLTVTKIIWLNLGAVFITLIFVLIRLRPSFENLSYRLREVWAKNKTFGFMAYIGSASNQITFRLDEILIAFFVNLTSLGFYTLAAIICSPMVMLSKALSSSLFKQFAIRDKIPTKVFVFNTVWLVFCVAFLYFISKYIIVLIFGNEYAEVATIVIPLSIAYFFQGMYQPLIFLSAKSQGKAIRNVGLLEAFLNIAGNLILIPLYGVTGAIVASIVAKFVHFIAKLYYYRTYLREQNEVK